MSDPGDACGCETCSKPFDLIEYLLSEEEPERCSCGCKNGFCPDCRSDPGN